MGRLSAFRAARAKFKYTIDDPRIEPCPMTGCWLWASHVDVKGYGMTRHLIEGRSKSVRAHRMTWETRNGPIPDGLVVDHLCRVRSCVNPDHLRVVTRRVNNTENSESFAAKNLSKTHCINGHPFSGDNLYLYPKGYRGCRICLAAHARRADQKRTAKRRAARMDTAGGASE